MSTRSLSLSPSSSMAIGLDYISSSHRQFCHWEELSCSVSAGTTTNRVKSDCDGRTVDNSSIRFRRKSSFFGSRRSYRFLQGQQLSLSRAQVAADYPDSLPDSSKHADSRGYHPLEELKRRDKKKDMMLTDAEIARTTVEKVKREIQQCWRQRGLDHRPLANNKALLLFPGGVHREPHTHVSWGEFQYIIDDYGDIYFEFFDDENILHDHETNNPVTVMFGSDYLFHKESIEFSNNFDIESEDIIDISEFHEIDDTDITDILISWGMPDTLRYTHPLYFARCLSKAVQTKYGKMMDCPSNGLCIVGCLRPAFVDEESYIRRLFHPSDVDGYVSDWRDELEKVEEQNGTFDLIDGSLSNFSFKRDQGSFRSTLHKLEIMTMELCSVYGRQSMIDLPDFQDAEPDILAHSASAVIQRIEEYGLQSSIALKALCRRKKGLNVEGAYLIGVDSLGMDVRVCCGIEARTIRFSFNSRAMTESTAEKKIKRMLFPRYHRKSVRSQDDGSRDK